jgi:LAS superfamily LD-carboxypeptidase LdcB
MNPLFLVLAVAAVGAIIFGSATALGYIKGKPVWIEIASIGNSQFLEVKAASAFSAMARAAAVQNVNLKVNSAFRSTEDQIKLQETRAEFAAAVNRSPHQAGIAVDIESGGGNNDSYRWLVVNAHKFKFVSHATLYPNSTVKEPWHWEFRPERFGGGGVA